MYHRGHCNHVTHFSMLENLSFKIYYINFLYSSGRRTDKFSRYLVTIITAKCLDRENTIVNLANSAVGNELLSSNEKAKAYSRTYLFEFILIYWNLPPTTVVRCRRYFYDPVSKVVNFEKNVWLCR